MIYRGNVPELTPEEIDAIMVAANDGGEYLDTLGKTDLATMTEQEWLEFMECVCIAYAETIKKRLASDEIPY